MAAWPILAESSLLDTGQVYRGRLKSGEEVAVKVQRPFVLETVTVDLYILRYLLAPELGSCRHLHQDVLLAELISYLGAQMKSSSRIASHRSLPLILRNNVMGPVRVPLKISEVCVDLALLD